MKRNDLFRNIIAISVGFGAMILLGTGSSKAVLQSNGNDGATYNLSDWMMTVRKMEELGGAMGLSESINDDLTSSSASNNIDVHMQKNTEYGALAILSASSYGNPGKVNDGETTTGNATGVVMKLNQEWVAAGFSELPADNFMNSVNKYKNLYNKSFVAKRGDAIMETQSWHGSDMIKWNINPTESGIKRSRKGSIFSFYAISGYNSYYGNDPRYDAYYKKNGHSRAVVVQGEGI